MKVVYVVVDHANELSGPDSIVGVYESLKSALEAMGILHEYSDDKAPYRYINEDGHRVYTKDLNK